MNRINIFNNYQKITSIFIPSLIFLLTSINLNAIELGETLYSILNFSNLQVINLTDFSNLKKQISTGYIYKDIYRKKVENSLNIFSNDRSSKFYLSYPFKYQNVAHIVEFNLIYDLFEFSNCKDYTALKSLSNLKKSHLNLLYCANYHSKVFGIKVNYSQLNSTNKINIETFPISNDDNLNNFFLDWLEPTFSNNINSKLIFHNTNFLGWYSFPIKKNQRIMLKIAYKYLKGNMDGKYFNNSNKLELQGNRKIDFPISKPLYQASISINYKNSIIKTLELGGLVENWKFEADNNFKGMIDFRNLGRGQFERHGIFSNLKAKIFNIHIHGSLTYTKYTGFFNLSTPVLGFYETLIPISHNAEGKISESFCFSQRIKGYKHISLGKSAHEFSVSYCQARYNFYLKGKANLEFGLISTPIDAKIKLNAYLWDFSYQTKYQFKYFDLIYDFNQLIPFTKRKDHSDFKISSEAPKIKKNYRGGQMHSLFITYYL